MNPLRVAQLEEEYINRIKNLREVIAGTEFAVRQIALSLPPSNSKAGLLLQADHLLKAIDNDDYDGGVE